VGVGERDDRCVIQLKACMCMRACAYVESYYY